MAVGQVIVLHLLVLNDGTPIPRLGFRDNRIGAAEFTIPANTGGPPAHWHEMDDKTFLITQGVIRFHVRGGQSIDAKVGDYVTAPPRAPRTFSNPFDEEAKIFNTFTPAYYINYFKLMVEWQQ